MEQRNSDRIETDLDVSFAFGNEVSSGVLKNASEGGMFINTDMCFPARSYLDVFIPMKKSTLKVPAKVRRLSRTGDTYDGMGVEVLGPPFRYLEWLKTLESDKQRKAHVDFVSPPYFVCNECRHIEFYQPPLNCPFCNASIDSFSEDDKAVYTIYDIDDVEEFHRQHFPVVSVLKEYGSGQQYRFVDIRVKVGEIEHGMTLDDRISFIDLYFNELNENKRCISRVNINCRKMSPETILRLNDIVSGVLSVVSHCNNHGSWMTEIRV